MDNFENSLMIPKPFKFMVESQVREVIEKEFDGVYFPFIDNNVHKSANRQPESFDFRSSPWLYDWNKRFKSDKKIYVVHEEDEMNLTIFEYRKILNYFRDKGIDSKKVYFILSAHTFNKVIDEPHLLLFHSNNKSDSNGLIISQTDTEEFNGDGLWSWLFMEYFNDKKFLNSLYSSNKPTKLFTCPMGNNGENKIRESILQKIKDNNFINHLDKHDFNNDKAYVSATWVDRKLNIDNIIYTNPKNYIFLMREYINDSFFHLVCESEIGYESTWTSFKKNNDLFPFPLWLAINNKERKELEKSSTKYNYQYDEQGKVTGLKKLTLLNLSLSDCEMIAEPNDIKSKKLNPIYYENKNNKNWIDKIEFNQKQSIMFKDDFGYKGHWIKNSAISTKGKEYLDYLQDGNKVLSHNIKENFYDVHSRLGSRLTEKTLIPIMYKKPFFLLGPINGLEILKSYGFKTFSDIIDESYDKETDLNKKIDMVMSELLRLSKKSNEELLEITKKVNSVVNHNYDIFIECISNSRFLKKVIGNKLKK
jgi:hypothetical protein